MEKIIFKNGQSPALNGTNLNQLQTNVENAINELIGLLYPIGSYYETSDVNFNPNTSWGGTWELDNDGTVLVSKSMVSGSKFNVDLGTVIGEEEHILTTDEMPEHNHTLNIAAGTGGELPKGYTVGITEYGRYAVNNLDNNTTGDFSNFGINKEGKDQSHNNVQPSKVVNRWHRIA